MPVKSFLVAVLVVFLTVGCNDEKPTAPSSSPSARETVAATPQATSSPEEANLPPAPTKPQPKLPTLPLFIGTNELSAEIARNYTEISTGMMWRTNMAEMEAMLFVFPSPRQVSFYMRNTLLPLSCAYISPEGVILELHNMKPRDLTSIKASTDQVQYVLEVNQGWFQRHNVSTGMTVSTSHGPLGQTFFRR